MMLRVKMNIGAAMFAVKMMSAGRNDRPVRPCSHALRAPRHFDSVFRARLSGIIDRLMHTSICSGMHQLAADIKPSGSGRSAVKIGAAIRHGNKAGISALPCSDRLAAAVAGNRPRRRIKDTLLAEDMPFFRARRREHGKGIQFFRRVTGEICAVDNKALARHFCREEDCLLCIISTAYEHNTVASQAGARAVIIAFSRMTVRERRCACVCAVREGEMNPCPLQRGSIGFRDRSCGQQHLPRAFTRSGVPFQPIQSRGITGSRNDGKIDVSVLIGIGLVRLHRNRSRRSLCRAAAGNQQQIGVSERFERINAFGPGVSGRRILHSIPDLRRKMRLLCASSIRQLVQDLFVSRRETAEQRKIGPFRKIT